MTILDYQSIMLPLLKYLGDEKEHSLRESIEKLAEYFNLNREEKRQLLPSGKQAIFDNRVGWAKTYLKKAGLLVTTRRGYFKIKEETKDELLETIKKCSPEFFEKLVIDLLIAMGYGGSRKEAGEAVGKVNDGGIDGIIKEDRLGLDIIYLQAKRWQGTVGRPEIQKFAGALLGQQAKKGIFITTSQFSKEAIEYATMIDSKIILIDGQKLSEFLIDDKVGVSLVESDNIKRIDIDYFTE